MFFFLLVGWCFLVVFCSLCVFSWLFCLMYFWCLLVFSCLIEDVKCGSVEHFKLVSVGCTLLLLDDYYLTESATIHRQCSNKYDVFPGQKPNNNQIHPQTTQHHLHLQKHQRNKCFHVFSKINTYKNLQNPL